MLVMASWPFFAIGFLPRHPLVVPNCLISSYARFSCRGELWSSKTWSLELLLALLLALTSIWRHLAFWFAVASLGASWMLTFWNSFPPWRHISLWRVGLCSSFNFVSLILVLFTLFPAQLSQVRYKKHNRVFHYIFMAFP